MSWYSSGSVLEETREDTGRAPAPKQGSKVPWKALIATVFLCIVLFTLMLFSFDLVFGQRVAPGVTVATVDIGGLQKEDAIARLTSSFDGFNKSQLVLKQGEQEWRITPPDLKVRYDPNASFDQAFEYGRDGMILQRMVAYAAAFKDGKAIDPVMSLDEAKLKEYLDKIAKDVDREPVNAGLQFDGLQLKTVPAQHGQKLDREGATQAIKARLTALVVAPLDLPLAQVTPKVLEFSLDQARAEADKIVDAPIRLRMGDKNWTIDRPTLATMVSFKETPSQSGELKVTLELNEEKVQAFASKIAKEIEKEPRKARFKYENGKLSPILESQEGLKFDRTRFSELLKEVVKKQGDRSFDLPVSVVKPTVATSDMAKIVIKDKIEERGTSYAGSIPERAHNVRLGASRLNGVVLAPGETFSFNNEVGPVTAESGYQLGFAIIGAETVPDAGGGICQVSTTIFQTAFWMGLPIVERYPHSYRMRRYEPPAGLDSTVYAPQVDFRFKNDTENYILIQSRTDDANVYFTFYGVKPNRTVTIEGPIFTNIRPADKTIIRQNTPALKKGREVWAETAEDGVDVSLTRIVTKDGKVILKDTFKSSYRPERNVILVGTGP